MARASTRTATTADVIRSMAVLLGAVVVIVVVFNALRPDAELPDRVDYTGVVELVKDEYPYEVVAPASVPEGWRATSVDHQEDAAGHRWRVGFLTDDEGFVGLEQADGEIQSYLVDRMRDFELDGTSTIDGVTWERWEQTTSPHDRALVVERDGVVTIVRGTESYETLDDFAARLAPA